MFTIRCIHQTTANGPIFLPEDCESDRLCDLQVDIAALGHERAEPDVGAGPTFGWEIEAIWIIEYRWGTGCPDASPELLKRRLDDAGEAAAKRFLERYCQSDLHEQACAETAEAFGAVFWRAA